MWKIKFSFSIWLSLLCGRKTVDTYHHHLQLVEWCLKFHVLKFSFHLSFYTFCNLRGNLQTFQRRSLLFAVRNRTENFGFLMDCRKINFNISGLREVKSLKNLRTSNTNPRLFVLGKWSDDHSSLHSVSHHWLLQTIWLEKEKGKLVACCVAYSVIENLNPVSIDQTTEKTASLTIAYMIV